MLEHRSCVLNPSWPSSVSASSTAHLANFRGIVQVDGYTGFGQVVTERADSSVKLAFCWVHEPLPVGETGEANARW